MEPEFTLSIKRKRICWKTNSCVKFSSFLRPARGHLLPAGRKPAVRGRLGRVGRLLQYHAAICIHMQFLSNPTGLTAGQYVSSTWLLWEPSPNLLRMGELSYKSECGPGLAIRLNFPRKSSRSVLEEDGLRRMVPRTGGFWNQGTV